METFVLNSIYISIFLPLWIFLIIMCGRFFSVYVDKKIIYSSTLFSSLIGTVTCGVGILKLSSDTILESSFNFIKINNLVINCGLHIDRLALLFAGSLFVISFFVQFFSISYMRNETKNYRFFALLNLFNFVMVSLFFSPNLFQTYFFWELAGVVSYLLIGFEYNKEEKSIASKKVFIINRIGDTALICGIILCSYIMYNYVPNTNLASLSFIDFGAISTLVLAFSSIPLFTFICLMFIFSALVKSAQLPFYTWLQDAMTAKLPVSALLHSATLVSLGIFLMIRLMPFLTLSEVLIKLLIFTGLFTVIICSISATSQVEPKKVLAYSTSAQLGLVFVALGLLKIKLAICLFVIHAFIKTVLFLTLPKENEKWDFANFMFFVLSGLSLSGLLFAGLIPKEILFYICQNKIIAGIVCLSSFLTAFYISRIALLLKKENKLGYTKPKFVELFAISGLFICNLVLYFGLHKYANYKLSLPFIFALVGYGYSYILYKKYCFKFTPILHNVAYNGFYLNTFYTTIITRIYEKFCKFLNLIDTKVFGNYYIFTSCLKKCIRLIYFVEEKIMHGTIRKISYFWNFSSRLYKKLQTGSIQKYNTYAFVILTLIFTCMVFIYVTIINFVRSN